jgi:ribonuclease P protein component
MPKQFTLGRDERLKSRKQIEKLFVEGKSFVVTPFRIYYLIGDMVNARLPDGQAQRSMFNDQFGVGVSSKNFKRAVDRNRIKRLTREAWRLQKTDPVATGLKEWLKTSNKQLDVFFIYTGKEVPAYKLVFEKVRVVIEKLIKAIEQTGKP